MGKIKSIYIRDELEWQHIKLCLEIYRSGLNKDQVKTVFDTAAKAKGKAAKKESIDYAYEGKDFWGKSLPTGWKIRDLGPVGEWIEGPNDERVYKDKSGDFEAYVAACEKKSS